MSRRPNILLIVIDALRADHVSACGYERPTTPAIEELARDGVLFSQAVSCAPWTLPSHASIFTGLYPIQHGARDGRSRLEPTIPVIAEILGNSFSYRTMAFAHNDWISSLTGLDRGFQEFYGYKAPIRPYQLMSEAILRKIWRYGRLQLARWAGIRPASNCEVQVKAICSRLQSLCSSTQSPPWFIFAHFMEPHRPWRPPARFFKRVADTDLDSRDLKLGTVNVATKYNSGQFSLSESELSRSIALYDGTVAYVDDALRPLFAFLEDSGLADNTLIIVTADHGENLGDHGLMEHQFCLYDTVLRVPLVLRYPGYLDGGHVFAGQVQTSDLFHTILHLLGADEEEHHFQSKDSLLTTLKDTSARGKPYTFAEYARPVLALSVLKARAGAYDPKFDTALSCVRTSTHKLIHAHAFGTSELYDLVTDPAETRNVIEEQPQEAETLSRVLDDFMHIHTLPHPELAKNDAEEGGAAEFIKDVDPEVYERLRGLGYVE